MTSPTPEPQYSRSQYGPGLDSRYPSAIMPYAVSLDQLTDERREYLFKQYPELRLRVQENPETYGTLITESRGPSVGGKVIDASASYPNGYVSVGLMKDDSIVAPLPGDDKVISVRDTLRKYNIQVEGLEAKFDVGEDISFEVKGNIVDTGTMRADVENGKPQQITAGSLAKSFLVWQTNRQANITKRELKKFLDKLWPDITGEELWKRTKVCWEVTEQLRDNGWLKSEEAIRMKQFDLRAGSRKGITMRVG